MLEFVKQLTIPQWAAIAFLAYMYVSGKLNWRSVVSLLAPAGATTPTPAPPSNAADDKLLLSMLRVLGELLTQAKQSGDKPVEDAIVTVIPKVCKYGN
jgi:hypothetical protein